MRGALRATLCALALLASAGAVPARAATVKPPEFFGVNAQYVFKLSQGQWDRHLAAIARTGVAEVRRDAFWSQVEPNAPVNGVHSYTWTALDAIAAALARNGLRWYPILDYSTSWSGSLDGSLGWKSAPRNPADYAAYAAAFAHRYGSGGSFWSAHPSLPALPVRSYEVWNEPNHGEFWPDAAGAGQRYADLLAATLPALRAADPSGRVVVGGLSPTSLTTFLDSVEARRPGLIAKADAVAFHPYGTTWTDTGSRIRTLRDWLDAHGAAALPLEITETGWATPPLPESTRAARMSLLVSGLATSSCAISRFIAFTWLTPDVDSTDPSDYFGIAQRDASLKPTGAAFASAVSAVEHGTETAPSDPCAGRVNAAAPVPGAAPAPAAAAPAQDAPAAAPAAPASDVALGPDPFPAASVTAPAHPASSAGESGIDVRARRRGATAVVVEVTCARACRATVRARRAGASVAGSRADARFALRHRTTLHLSRRARRPLTVRVRVELRGEPPVTLVRSLR